MKKQEVPLSALPFLPRRHPYGLWAARSISSITSLPAPRPHGALGGPLGWRRSWCVRAIVHPGALHVGPRGQPPHSLRARAQPAMCCVYTSDVSVGGCNCSLGMCERERRMQREEGCARQRGGVRGWYIYTYVHNLCLHPPYTGLAAIPHPSRVQSPLHSDGHRGAHKPRPGTAAWVPP